MQKAEATHKLYRRWMSALLESAQELLASKDQVCCHQMLPLVLLQLFVLQPITVSLVLPSLVKLTLAPSVSPVSRIHLLLSGNSRTAVECTSCYPSGEGGRGAAG